MTTAQLVIVCSTVLLLALVAAGTLAHREQLRAARRDDAVTPPRVGHRVTIHTKQPDDQTIFGVLIGDYADRLVLTDAEYVTPRGGQPIPGEPHIATRDVAWIDVHALVALPDHAPVATQAADAAGSA